MQIKVNSLTLRSPGYPEVLKHIPERPQRLFWAGVDPAEWLGKPRVAIVGSRKASYYGRGVTQKIAGELARAGVVIISGLALGIDSIAHQAALDAGGCTVAVLPTPLQQIYPSSHVNLARQIIEQGGSLISEYADSYPGYRVNFIARNRIVSGLADILLITEAAVNSGTLHTARFALEQGKTVMVVPGNITNLGSEGCNNLIKSGAVPVTTVEDIFFALNIRFGGAEKAKKFRGSPEAVRLLRLIANGISDQEDLALACQLNGSAISSTLTMLEIAGYIKPSGNGHWHAA
jgi:DNA processing protein